MGCTESNDMEVNWKARAKKEPKDEFEAEELITKDSPKMKEIQNLYGLQV